MAPAAVARDGRWGRNIETPGEDPYTSGEYATSFVRGFQESAADPGHLMASACCKHYVANSVEHSTEDDMTWDRFEIDSEVTQQDMVDSCECRSPLRRPLPSCLFPPLKYCFI